MYLHENGRLRLAPRLVVVTITHRDSLASGLLRPVLRRTCNTLRHSADFAEMAVDSFPEAANIAKSLGVRKLPFVILWKDGKRVDHFGGLEARKHLDQIVYDHI